jgi:hypothetical protein
LRSCSMPGTALSTFTYILCLIIAILSGRYYYLKFTDKDADSRQQNSSPLTSFHPISSTSRKKHLVIFKSTSPRFNSLPASIHFSTLIQSSQ